MTDIVDPKQRSRMMSGIRAKNTRPEVSLRSALHKLGFRYRIHDSRLPGKPDIVLPRYHAAVLVHGCFWHRHGCSLTATPATNREFWMAKFEANVARDSIQHEELLNQGWRVATVWECEIRKLGAEILAECLVDWLRGDKTQICLPVTNGERNCSAPLAL